MSSAMIARWNAITMNREGDEGDGGSDGAKTGLKRRRSQSIGEEGYYKDDDEDANKPKGTWHVADENEDDEDDSMSIVSRTPSPSPPDADGNGDINMEDVNKYDEHVRGYAREAITVETKIKSTNKGFGMLSKMGWVEGQPLGLSGDGRVDPIPFSVKNDMTGLGKISQDYEVIESTVAQRRNLDSERMQFETEEQKQAREASVAQKATIQSEISTVLRAFYCELCDKQFKNVAQYDEHTNSYAHHHKARMKDLHSNHPMRMASAADAEVRKEKERRREEKELRKMAKAMGVKMTPGSGTPSATGSAKADPASSEKKSGWTTVNSAPETQIPPVASVMSSNKGLSSSTDSTVLGAGRASAWQSIPPTPPHQQQIPATTIAPSSGPPPFSFAPPPPPPHLQLQQQQDPVSDWHTLPASSGSSGFEDRSAPPLQQQQNPSASHTPSFKSTGWTESTIESSSPNNVWTPSAPPSAGPPRRSGWTPVPPNVAQRQALSGNSSLQLQQPPSGPGPTIPSSTSSSSSSFSSPANQPIQQPQQLTSSSTASPGTTNSTGAANVPAASTKQSKKVAKAAAEEQANKARGNWQSFKKGFGKR